MKLNYSLLFADLDGNPFPDNNGKQLDLGHAIITSCSIPVAGDEALDMVAKYRVGEIAAIVHKGLDLTAEQIASVKVRTAKAFSPYLVYLIHEALENAGTALGVPTGMAAKKGKQP